MLRYLTKFALDMMPSVAATIVGAFIVHHFVIPMASPHRAATADPAAAGLRAAEPQATNAKSSDNKPPNEKSSSEKASFEKASFEKSSFEKAVAEKAAIEKAAEKAAEKSADAASASNDARRRHSTSREKPAAKPSTSATIETTASIPSAAPAIEERRDVNNLARAAIERLRNGGGVARAPDAARPNEIKGPDKGQDAPRVQDAAHIVPAMQPLPPAIAISTPGADVFESGGAAPVVRQPYPQTSPRADGLYRPSPPAEIPGSPSLDLRAEASPPVRASVAEDVMAAAKSMFHAVLPR